MKPGLQIRPASRSDVTLILELVRELADFEKLLGEVVATEQSLEATLFCDRPYAEVLIAEWEGAPAGFALFFHNYSTFLGRPGIYLEDLFVRPAFRSRGIGEELIRALARETIRRGCGRLEWSVLDWNERAIAFYRRLGAQPMDDWTVQRVTGEALMRLAER